jgi:hypothetical protein
MKATGVCPKCKGGSLLYVANVAANTRTGTSQQQPTFHLAVNGNGPYAFAGQVEAYACQSCGCVEMYLKEAIRADGVHIHEYRRPPSPPYR